MSNEQLTMNTLA